MRVFLYIALCLTVLCLSIEVSALPNAAPSLYARDPKPKPSPALEARSPWPSKALEARSRSSPKSLEARARRKRDQRILTEEEALSRQLCPFELTVCPLPSHSTPSSLGEWVKAGFECVDVMSDLNSCGGCGTLDERHDCTMIPGALAVSCVTGGCKVDTCQPGWTRSSNGTACIHTS